MITSRLRVRRALAITALLAISALAAPATAQVDFNYRGFIENDLRFAVPGKPEPAGVDKFRFIRNESWANAGVSIGWGDARAVGDLSLVFTGLPDVTTMPDLVQRHQVDPFRIESNALYVEVLDFIVPGLELRVGRQIVQWGTADYFNPTNNLNPYDLEDPLKFGELVANEMLFLNYRIPLTIEGEDTPILDDVNLSVAVVPYFRPGLLPGFSMLAFSDPSLFGQFVDSPTLKSLLTVQRAFEERGGIIGYDTQLAPPDLGLDNVQVGTRLSWTLLGVDMSVSHFYGYDDVPRAERISATNLPLPIDPTNIDQVLDLIQLLNLTGTRIDTQVQLTFPRMHVLGVDFATSLDFLDGLGLWGELAIIFHDEMYRTIELGTATVLEREYKKEHFLKWTVGLDYSITSFWYINAQWVHGFVDEFGGKNLNDYLVAGMDFNLFGNQMLIRAFAILNFQDLSYVLYPQLSFKFWKNTEITAGAFVYGGEDDSKFGSRITGPSTVFTRARYSF